MDRNYLSQIALPDEVSHFVFKVYGYEHYNPVYDDNFRSHGLVMLRAITSLTDGEISQYKRQFGPVIHITKATAPWLIGQGVDCFGFIDKGWVCDIDIYEKSGYEKAMAARDKLLLKYEREERRKEEQIGIREESDSLFVRKSWTTLGKPEKQDAVLVQEIRVNGLGWVIYRNNEWGKIISRQVVSEDGELLYEGEFKYIRYKDNLYLSEYRNTNGVRWRYEPKNRRYA
jgi:hypothetical protein